MKEVVEIDPRVAEFADRGYVMLEGILDVSDIRCLLQQLDEALQADDSPAVLKSRGEVYGSRNLVESFPQVARLPARERLREFVAEVLGPRAGVVRALYFDKPPDRTWSLPWHRDRTIAVRKNDLAGDHFRNPTVKAGIPHVEAAECILRRMLTLRVHLDPMTGENGPLSVIPGSHQESPGKELSPTELSAEAGDVLAMRPLLSHSSRCSREGTTMHRRVIHLELSPDPKLPDGYEWYRFDPIFAQGS